MPKTILIADNEPDVIKIIVQSFREYKQNYTIYQAPDGAIACQISEEKLPDLIILDWDMPVMNGLEATQYLNRQEKTKDIPIMIATGKMIKDLHLGEALEKGAIDYIRKPINSIELVARVNSALKLSESYKKIKEQSQKMAESHQKEKELMQQLLDYKNRELFSNETQLINKNSLLLEIQKLVESKNFLDNKSKIQKLISDDVRFDIEWNKIKRHFEEVHPNFFNKLTANFPSLTKNELRICAYTQMYLTNKEIMFLLNIASKGLETARYRIKKKLNLSKSQSLDEFIRGI